MKRFVAYVFVPWLRPRTRAGLRLPWVVATLVLCTAVALVAALSAPQPPGTTVFELDASNSVGLDYTNLYIPHLLEVLPDLVGRQVAIVRVGGLQEILFEGILQELDLEWLRPQLLASLPFDPQVKGSPISQESVGQAVWLAQQGKGGLLVVMTDGIEQPLGPFEATPASATAVHALVLFARSDNPYVMEALKMAGASVTVEAEPAQAARALDTAITGVPAALRWLRARWLLLLVLAIVCLRLSLRGVAQPPEVVVSPAPLPDPYPLPVEEEILPPAVVNLTVSVEGESSLFTRRRLTCGAGQGLIVARAGAPRADLRLPLRLLEQSTEVAVRLAPLDLEHVRVSNVGRTWIVAGRRRLEPGGEVDIRIDDDVRVSPDATLSLDVEMEEDDAIRMALS